MIKRITLEELLKILEPQIKYLSSLFRIKDFDRDDIAQELRMLIIEEVRRGKGQGLGVDAWFKRLKWHLIYIYRREKRESLGNSISIDAILEAADEYKNKKRAGKNIYIIEGGF